MPPLATAANAAFSSPPASADAAEAALSQAFQPPAANDLVVAPVQPSKTQEAAHQKGEGTASLEEELSALLKAFEKKQQERSMASAPDGPGSGKTGRPEGAEASPRRGEPGSLGHRAGKGRGHARKRFVPDDAWLVQAITRAELNAFLTIDLDDVLVLDKLESGQNPSSLSTLLHNRLGRWLRGRGVEYRAIVLLEMRKPDGISPQMATNRRWVNQTYGLHLHLALHLPPALIEPFARHLFAWAMEIEARAAAAAGRPPRIFHLGDVTGMKRDRHGKRVANGRGIPIHLQPVTDPDGLPVYFKKHMTMTEAYTWYCAKHHGHDHKIRSLFVNEGVKRLMR